MNDKQIIFDKVLDIEQYTFNQLEQPFPNHFHNYYVIGIIENGQRHLICNDKKCIINKDNIIIFNPRDSHGCTQSSNEKFIYKALNINTDVMEKTVSEITEKYKKPLFSQNIIYNEEIYNMLLTLHRMIINGGDEFEKEELFFIIISELIKNYSNVDKELKDNFIDTDNICKYLEENYYKKISLDKICVKYNLSKSTILRNFSKHKNITPYRYLQAVRIEKAKILLKEGISPAETALRTGFYDQSHFTNCFAAFIGLTPTSYSAIFKEGNCDEEIIGK